VAPAGEPLMNPKDRGRCRRGCDAAVKQLVLARIERRPARLDLSRYPYLPAARVKTTAAADYAALLSRSAA
jgi:hypothetical protein